MFLQVVNYKPLKLKSISNGEANFSFSKSHIGAKPRFLFSKIQLWMQKDDLKATNLAKEA